MATLFPDVLTQVKESYGADVFMSLTASLENPIYSAYIITKKKKYNVTNALVSMDFSEQDGQMAASASINLADADVDGSKLSSLISSRDRVIVIANDGEKKDEVFRGYIWDMTPKEALTEADIPLKCYDNLIYLQESEDSHFFSEGRSTQDVVTTLFTKWGINVAYGFRSITHGKLICRGYISDFIAEVLNAAQDKGTLKYVIQSVKDKVMIRYCGENKTVYTIGSEHNATVLRRHISMGGVVTQVVVLGTADDDGKTPIEATLSKNTNEYGTIQTLIDKDEDTTLADAKTEAHNILLKNGSPQWEYDISAVDIPWIRKGDKVQIEIKPLSGLYVVKSVNHEVSNRGKKMTLTVYKSVF